MREQKLMLFAVLALFLMAAIWSNGCMNAGSDDDDDSDGDDDDEADDDDDDSGSFWDDDDDDDDDFDDDDDTGSLVDQCVQWYVDCFGIDVSDAEMACDAYLSSYGLGQCYDSALNAFLECFIGSNCYEATEIWNECATELAEALADCK
jgi:hypothetical protein